MSRDIPNLSPVCASSPARAVSIAAPIVVWLASRRDCHQALIWLLVLRQRRSKSGDFCPRIKMNSFDALFFLLPLNLPRTSRGDGRFPSCVTSACRTDRTHRISDRKLALPKPQFGKRRRPRVPFTSGPWRPGSYWYGHIAGAPSTTGQSTIPIRFERMLDPEVSVLATSEELKAITNAREVWGTQASGVTLLAEIAQTLEHLVVGREPIAVSGNGTPALVQPISGVQLTSADFALFERHPFVGLGGDPDRRSGTHTATCRKRLETLSEGTASCQYPSRTKMRAFQSHPTPNGRNPTELWCCIFPEEVANKSFALQFALIVSRGGVEICFCLGAGAAQTDPQALAPLRADFFRMRARLSELDPALAAATDSRLVSEVGNTAALGGKCPEVGTLSAFRSGSALRPHPKATARACRATYRPPRPRRSEPAFQSSSVLGV